MPKQEKEKEGARGWGDKRRWSDNAGPKRKNSRNRKRYNAVWAVEREGRALHLRRCGFGHAPGPCEEEEPAAWGQGRPSAPKP